MDLSHDAEPVTPDALARHAGFVRAVARRLLADEGLAEDVAQETWLAALEAPPRSGAALTAWLETVARRFALRTLRSGARRREREQRGARDEALLSVADELGRESVLRVVSDAVLALDEPYRSVVFGRYYEDKSVARLAAEAGCPVATVESRLRRARLQLRERLDREHGRDPWCAALIALVAPPPIAERAALWTAGTTTMTGTLIMSTQLKWAAAGAVAILAVVVGGSLLDTDAVERTGTEPRSVAVSTALPERGRDAEASAAPALDPGERIAVDDVRAEGSAAIDDARPELGALHLTARYASGAPAPDREVTLYRWGGSGDPFHDRVQSRTGEDGTVLLEELDPGEVRAALDLSGTWRATIVAGETVELDVAFPPGVDVVGRVLAPDGQAVAGARIWVSEYGIDTNGFLVAESADDGSFRVDQVPPKRRIAAMAEGFGPAPLLQVHGTPGETVRLDLRLTADGAHLSGLCVDRAGAPVAGARLFFHPDDPGLRTAAQGESEHGLPPYETTSGADGAFELTGLPATSGLWMARKAGFAPILEPTSFAAGERAERVVVLAPAGVVRGLVTDEEGEPVAGAQLQSGRYGAPEASMTTTGEDGCYELAGLQLGEVTIQVEHDEEGRASTTLALVAGQPREWSPQLERGLVLRGRVTTVNGAPLAGWFVDVAANRPEPGERTLWSEQRRTDADGRFEVVGAPDRALHATLRDPSYGYNPVQSRRELFVSDGELLFLVDPDAAPSTTVVGEVRRADGASATGRMRVSSVDAETRFQLEGPLESGVFEVGLLPKGRYQLNVIPDGAPELPLLRFEVDDASERIELEPITLPAPARLVLRCADPAAFDALRLSATPIEGEPRRWPTIYTDPLDTELVLWPGRYDLRLMGPGSAPLHDDLELEAGERHELEVEAIAGARCTFVAELPAGSEGLSYLFFSVVQDDAGVASWGLVEPAKVGYSRSGRIAPGEYVVKVHDGVDGVKGEASFVVEPGAEALEVRIPLR